jgi:23S rRNA (pseudouridine1915-N3)-methyltransferase
MQLKVLAIGKPSLEWARRGIDEYADRLRRYGTIGVEYLKEGTPAQNAERLLASSHRGRRIVLDERGSLHNTAEARRALDRWELSGVKRVSFLVGGADGHSDAVRESADEIWALSRFTLQHELALVVLLEQLYRIYTIKRGEPYHR